MTRRPPSRETWISLPREHGLQMTVGSSRSLSRASPARLAAPDLAVAADLPAVLKSGGRPLDPADRRHFEPRFAFDFSSVRIHDDGRAGHSAMALGARAYTVGPHIAFAPGELSPGGAAGRELLAHELAHVVQQRAQAPGSATTLRVMDSDTSGERQAEAGAGQALAAEPANSSAPTGISLRTVAAGLPPCAPAIQRREFPNDTPEAKLRDGDWLTRDRVYGTLQSKEAKAASVRWHTANWFNLMELRPNQYTQPHERRDFYLWAYNLTSDRGYETRWPLAAYLVASGAAKLSYGAPFENDVQEAARVGNQIIFDDVFPKLRELLKGPALKGKAAQEWDTKTLSEEQNLVQPMYSENPATTKRFAKYARQEGFLPTAGSAMGLTKPHRTGKYHRQLNTPAFKGEISKPSERFAYGMKLADLFSTHASPSQPLSPTSVSVGYSSGETFKKLDTKRGLHRLDALLDDVNVEEEKVVETIQQLSSIEQQELGFNDWRLLQLMNALDSEEMAQALKNRPAIPAEVKARLLQ